MVTARRIRLLLGVATDTRVAMDLETDIGSVLPHRRPPYLTGRELDRILRWKLRGQYGRQQKLRAQNTEAVIRNVTAAALGIKHDDPDYEVELKVAILTGLRGVGVRVASAILAITDPRKYGVIDFRAWRQLFGEAKTAFTVRDYKRYLATLRKLAAKLRSRVRDVDEAVWELDRRTRRRRR